MPDLIVGRPTAVGARVIRVLAPNAGFTTGPGTNSYLIGRHEVAVLDPGPDDDKHVDALLAAADACGGHIRWIVLTHTHQDHAPAASRLRAMTGATVLGLPSLAGDPAQSPVTIDRTLAHGETLKTKEFCLQALHTPGHVGNHVCYLLEEERLLFSGDHLINGSTVVIVPPSGNMADYLRSLELLAQCDIAAIAPGHGDMISDAGALVQYTIRHRLKREHKVLAHLRADPQSLSALTLRVYDDVSPALHPVAQYSLLAHLIKLRDEGKARESAAGWSSA